METGTKYAIKGISTGTAMAGTPIAAGIARNAVTKSIIEKEDMLSVRGSAFVTAGGSEILLQGINLDEPVFGCIRDDEEIKGDMVDIFDAIADRFGNYGAREVFNRCYESFITPADIKTIAKWGVNCVTIPLRSFLLVGDINDKKHHVSLKRLDKIIAACRKNGVYAVLSFDTAPGYQNNLKECGKAGSSVLFDKGKKGNTARSDTVKFWSQIADHYKDEPAVAAYNILSKPLYGVEKADTEALGKLYAKIIKAIRKAKDNHIVLLQSPTGADIETLVRPYGNAAFAFEGSFSSIYDFDNALTELVKIKGKDIPVMAVKLHPADYGKAIDALGENKISWTTGSYKGDMFCIFSGSRQTIDITNDSFDEINEKLKKPMSTKEFKENTVISGIIKEGIRKDCLLLHQPSPVEVKYAAGSAYSAGV